MYISKKIDSIDTKDLENALLSNKYESTKKTLKTSKMYMIDDKKAFSYFVRDLIEEKNMTIKQAIQYAGISENYGRKIISGEKKTKKRDTIIRICVASNFSLKETNRALKLYEMRPLYAKDERDAIIMIELNKGNTSVEEIDQALSSNGMKKLEHSKNI